MAIKAEFLAGQTEKRVSSLYQWDYGQTLEIEAPGLSTLVEVHFACPNMSEAIVHVCSVTNGVATVPIPDRCLEQSDLITAWVYEIEGTSGATTKVIYIPVVARTRPPRTHEIPQEVSDRYTELISEVNEAVEKITQGEIVVATAAKATSADRAIQADNASSAAHAITADRATQAVSADTAIADDTGRKISTTYQTINRGVFQPTIYMSPVAGNIYMFEVTISDTRYYATMPWVTGVETTVALGVGSYEGIMFHYYMWKSRVDTLQIWSWKLDGTGGGQVTDATIKFMQV